MRARRYLIGSDPGAVSPAMTSKRILVVTDLPVLTGDKSNLDTLFECISEGFVRANLFMMSINAVTTRHPYDSALSLKYKSDPRGNAYLSDGVEIRESFNLIDTIVKNGGDDCESLSQWLAAWYRYHGIRANVCVYAPSSGGRHACVYVARKSPLYDVAPWDSNKFIRHIGDDYYIEDPSMALGMNYYLRGVELPPRITGTWLT